MRSVNGGGSWTPGTSLPNARGLVAQTLGAGLLYAPASTPARVFRSVDDGATWTSSGAGLPTTGGAANLVTTR